jgi:hypothetical protein
MMKASKKSSLALALSAATCLTPVAVALAAPGDPAGGEFRVNSATVGNQSGAATAMDADGDFVVTWRGPDGDGYGVFAQRYNAAGEIQGGEFRVNSFTASDQGSQAVAMDADGDFVVTWMSYYQDGSYIGIYAQRYNAAGVPQGGEIRVSSSPSSGQILVLPAVAMDADGDFAIAWGSIADFYFSDIDVYARRFNAAGVAQGDEFRVNETVSDFQNFPAIAMDDDGDFVVTWDSYGQTGSYGYYDIFARRYNAAGTAQGSEFRVNNETFDEQGVSAVAMDADGDFVVTWQSFDQDGSGYGIFARRYNASGVAQGNEFQVNTETFDWQTAASVAMDADGNFAVTWDSYGQDGGSYDYGVFAQRYDAAGVAQGGEFQVNTTTLGSQSLPSIAMDDTGDFVVAWQSSFQDGDGYGIYAQRFEGRETAVNDFDGDALSDILWRNTSNGGNRIWRMEGFNVAGNEAVAAVPTSWVVEGVGDFGEDGKSDILWRNTANGSTRIWRMNRTTVVGNQAVGSVGPDWSVAGLGDFDGDGKSDVLWRNTVNGSTRIWRMEGLTVAENEAIGAVPTTWVVEGVGDFDGGGQADILWRNTVSGSIRIWQMNGFTIADNQAVGALLSSWVVEGVGDFDGGGQADILWRNSGSGSTRIWQMSGFTVADNQQIGTVGSAWAVEGLGDYNGGGQADILWRNASTGSNRIWQMNGLTVDDDQAIGNASSDWEVQ